VAATVNGSRITDSTVSHYVTPAAKSVSLQTASGGSAEVAPKPFVLQTLVYLRLLKEFVAAGPGHGPTKGEFASVRSRVLAGKSSEQYAHERGITGYTAAFDRMLVDQQAYAAVLNVYQQEKVDVTGIIRKARIDVSVSPRYGRWDKKALSLDGTAGAGLPSFVHLQPTSGSQDQSVAVPNP
jgi:hypothetical protein